MRLLGRFLWVLAPWVLAISGCTRVTEEPQTAPVSLFVWTRPAPEDELVALEGVEMCETETPNCESSDARGRVTIELPHDQEYSYTLEKDDYASYHIADIVSDAPDGYNYRFQLIDDERMARNHQSVMSQYPLQDMGTIYVFVGFAGATFELVGATGTPFYVDEDEENTWRPEPDLTQTTSVGRGGFTGVSSGEFKVRLSGSAQDCVTDQPIGFGLGWPSDEPNTIRVPVREGYINYASVNCPTP